MSTPELFGVWGGGRGGAWCMFDSSCRYYGPRDVAERVLIVFQREFPHFGYEVASFDPDRAPEPVVDRPPTSKMMAALRWLYSNPNRSLYDLIPPNPWAKFAKSTVDGLFNRALVTFDVTSRATRITRRGMELLK